MKTVADLRWITDTTRPSNKCTLPVNDRVGCDDLDALGDANGYRWQGLLCIIMKLGDFLVLVFFYIWKRGTSFVFSQQLTGQFFAFLVAVPFGTSFFYPFKTIKNANGVVDPFDAFG